MGLRTTWCLKVLNVYGDISLFLKKYNMPSFCPGCANLSTLTFINSVKPANIFWIFSVQIKILYLTEHKAD